MNAPAPTTERERELEQELATLTQMYEVNCRRLLKAEKRIEELEAMHQLISELK